MLRVDDDAAEPVEPDPAARIESVFARLTRCRRTGVRRTRDRRRVGVAIDEAPIEDVVVEAPIEDVVVEVVVEDVDVDIEDVVDEAVVEETGDADVAIEEVEPPAIDDLVARRRARDQVVIPATAGLMRRAKRILQDDQNEFLDAMRRQRPRSTPPSCCPASSCRWPSGPRCSPPAVDRSTGPGATPWRPAPARRPRSAWSATSPRASSCRCGSDCSQRSPRVLDEGPYEPAAELHRALGAAVGARYREWRSQDLEALVGDLLSAAYARGAFDAAPAGARLRWIPAEVDHCPDCDDNALEATVKGQPFPTGQTYPPAHPGCRCMLALADTSAP